MTIAHTLLSAAYVWRARWRRTTAESERLAQAGKEAKANEQRVTRSSRRAAEKAAAGGEDFEASEAPCVPSWRTAMAMPTRGPRRGGDLGTPPTHRRAPTLPSRPMSCGALHPASHNGHDGEGLFDEVEQAAQQQQQLRVRQASGHAAR